MEPMNSTYPNPGFLEGVREITKRHGIILVFDETITGFRFSEGGAQALFNVTPDLSTFGKGIANGFPLSVVAGKREIMMEMEEIFFSGTFGGELLSLAAAKVVLKSHIRKEVVPYLTAIGNSLYEDTESLLLESGLKDVLSLSGHPTWKFLNWRDHENGTTAELKTFFMQECFKSGILVLGTHNVNLAISKKDLKHINNSYQMIFSEMEKNLISGKLFACLEVKPLKPLFTIR